MTLRRSLKLGALTTGIVLLPCIGWAAFRMTSAVQAGTRAKAALIRGEAGLRATKLDDATRDLTQAQRDFATMGKRIRSAGPLLPLARITPILRVQVRGAEAFATAGRLLSEAGLKLTETAASVVNPTDPTLATSDALEALRRLQTSLDASLALLNTATDRVASLNGYRLFGPIGDARDELARRLPGIEDRATSAQQGMTALVAFFGGSGDRRYLFLSQNPAEVRPTGGYIGTYGVITARRGKVAIERYDSTESWTQPRPGVVIPPEQATAPFPYLAPKLPQTLANVNTVPDWPTVSKLAMQLWTQGGEAPVDGVLSVSTGFLVRLLGVVGPTYVPAYQETVTAVNATERLDFYTRRPVANRKDFVAALAEATLQQALDAPATKWQLLGSAIADSFNGREAMAWFADDGVEKILGERGWSGELPATDGDFFYSSEFAFATKNGRGLKRTYDHHVALEADGSGLVTTTVTIENTLPAGDFNTDSLAYITLYGPEGATLDPSSDTPVAQERMIASHPAAGWFRSAPPLGKAMLRVAWRVPKLLVDNADGSWTYSLKWMRVADHSGDVLNVRIDPPTGWTWKGASPAPTVSLATDIASGWTLSPSSK